VSEQAAELCIICRVKYVAPPPAPPACPACYVAERNKVDAEKRRRALATEVMADVLEDSKATGRLLAQANVASREGRPDAAALTASASARSGILDQLTAQASSLIMARDEDPPAEALPARVKLRPNLPADATSADLDRRDTQGQYRPPHILKGWDE